MNGEFDVEETPGKTAVDQLDEHDAESQASAILDAIREISTSGVRVQVSRKMTEGAKTGTYCYAGILDAEEFSLDAVARRFGGGSYKVAIMVPGKKGPKRQYVFEIDPSIKPEKKPDTAATAPATDPLIAKVFERFLTQPQQSPDSGLMPLIIAMIQQQGAMMTALIAAGGSKPQESQSDKFLASIQPLILRSMENQGGGGIGNVQKTIELIGALKGLIGEGGEESESMLGKILGAAGPLLAKLGGAPAVTVQPQPQIAAPPQAEQAPPQPSGLVEGYAHFIFAWCDQNQSVDDVAGRIEALMGDDQLEMIETALKREDWIVTMFGALAPDAEKRIGWLSALKNALLNPPADDDPEPTPPPPPQPPRPSARRA